MLHEQQDLEGAIALCRKAVEVDPLSNPNPHPHPHPNPDPTPHQVDPLCETAHVHMAHLCLQKNDLEAAVASYDLAVGLLRMKQARYLVITPPLAVGLLRMKQARSLVITPPSPAPRSAVGQRRMRLRLLWLRLLWLRLPTPNPDP